MLLLQSCGVAAVILVCGVLLVETAATIAAQSGLGSSFIGVTLLAATTSLPELSTTIAAVRIGAYTMAISNIFGSNLIMVLVLFPADIFYREGEILRQAGDMEKLALLSGIIVTTIYIIGLLTKKKPRILGMGVDSVLVLGAYLVSVYAFYTVR
jgi:cation:H+ antiporter